MPRGRNLPRAVARRAAPCAPRRHRAGARATHASLLRAVPRALEHCDMNTTAARSHARGYVEIADGQVHYREAGAALGIGDFDVVGHHTGCSVALWLAPRCRR
jgi:hypothetical protein